jgi:peptidyl-tRNA hydrolase, PTH1 family
MAPDPELWLVVGLGNPGTHYEDNRHNVGFMVVDLLSTQENTLRFGPSQRFEAQLAKGALVGRPAVLVKPQTYMNLSGRSVGPLAHFYRIPSERIAVVHDDVDLDLGRLKVKQGGGDAGHNGLRSLTECLGSADFIRVRFGIGRPEHGEVADFVLSGFRREEMSTVEEGVRRAARAVRTLITRGVKEAANRFNRDPRPRAEAAAKEEQPAGTESSTGDGRPSEIEQRKVDKT